MIRLANWLLMGLTLLAVFALYVMNYDTRQLEIRVQAQERDLEKADNDVSVLAAERAHLSRPEMLEPAAREIGLTPIAPRQYLRVNMQPRSFSTE